MAIELRQQLKLTQQLIMTPQLQMAIKLLQLSRLELVEKIKQELEENPALDEIQETLSPESNAEKEEKEANLSSAEQSYFQARGGINEIDVVNMRISIAAGMNIIFNRKIRG